MGFKYDLFGPGQNAILPSLLLQAEPSQATNQGLLGWATIDGNSAVEQLIPINAQEYIVTKVTVVIKTANLQNGSGDINTGPGGTGIAMGSPGWGGGLNVDEVINLTGNSLYNGGIESVLTSANLYYNNNPVEGAPATFNLYIYGDRIL